MISRKRAVAYYKRWLQDVCGDIWGEFWDGDGFRIMTYHQFGYEVQREPLFMLGIEIIICDEMHNLVKYRGIERTIIKNVFSPENPSTASHAKMHWHSSLLLRNCQPLL